MQTLEIFKEIFSKLPFSHKKAKTTQEKQRLLRQISESKIFPKVCRCLQQIKRLFVYVSNGIDSVAGEVRIFWPQWFSALLYIQTLEAEEPT